MKDIIYAILFYAFFAWFGYFLASLTSPYIFKLLGI